MATGGDPQSKQASGKIEQPTYTALWGRSPEGPCCFRKDCGPATRHSFASHLLQDGYDIRTVEELLVIAT